MAKIYAIRIDYELENKRDYKWTANIVSHNEEQAINFLRKNLGNIKILGIEKKTRIDAITEEIENIIIKNKVKKEEVKKEEVKKEEVKKTTNKKMSFKKGK